MNISGHAKVAGVVGWPVGHSLSPRLHGYWLKEHGIDGAHVPLAVEREYFAKAIQGLRAAGIVGVSVTNPHKEAAFALADNVDDAARAAGAANLLVFRNGEVEARNTDAYGFAAALTEALGEGAFTGKCAVLLGAGGAARGVALALDRLGAAEISIVARNLSRANVLAESLRAGTKTKLVAESWLGFSNAASRAALLVNATSAGLAGNQPLDLSLDALPRASVVCDIVYNPLETGLLKDARARGHRTIDGLGMLMHQAVPAFEAFFGVTPRVTSGLRTELEKALRHGG